MFTRLYGEEYRYAYRRLKGVLIGVLLQYERFSAFCYLCGRLDHRGVHCSKYVGGAIDDRLSPFWGMVEGWAGNIRCIWRGRTRSEGKGGEWRCQASDFALGRGRSRWWLR